MTFAEAWLLLALVVYAGLVATLTWLARRATSRRVPVWRVAPWTAVVAVGLVASGAVLESGDYQWARTGNRQHVWAAGERLLSMQQQFLGTAGAAARAPSGR